MAPISLLSTIHCDADQSPTASRAASAIKTVKSAIAVPENELKRWRRNFDSNAQTAAGDAKCVSDCSASFLS